MNLKHPFELELSDLEVLESVESTEQQDVSGARYISKPFTKALFENGGIVTTLALGEEGGSPCFPEPIKPEPPVKPCPPSDRPVPDPIATTLAIGEEGGGCFPPIAYS